MIPSNWKIKNQYSGSLPLTQTMLNSTWQGRYSREDLIFHLFSEILPPAVQKPQKIRILLAQNSQTSEELRSQTHRAWESYDACEPCVKGCSQGELGRCPAASSAFALLSKDTQEASQVHLVFIDSMSTYTNRISVLSSLRCLAGAPPRHFHQQKKQLWRKQVSFCQESALSWLIEKSKPSFKSTGKKKLFLFVLSGNTTKLMLWLQPSFAVPNLEKQMRPTKGQHKTVLPVFL